MKTSYGLPVRSIGIPPIQEDVIYTATSSGGYVLECEDLAELFKRIARDLNAYSWSEWKITREKVVIPDVKGKSKAFLSSDPMVLSQIDNWISRKEKWWADAKALSKEINPIKSPLEPAYLDYFGATRLTGFSWYWGRYDTEHPIPKGWKLDSKHFVIEPKSSHPEGKRVMTLLGKLGPLPDIRRELIGLKTDLFSTPGFVYELDKRIALINYKTEVTYGTPDAFVNSGYWKPISMSKFYEIRES